ncbi:MAG: transposase family protein [Pseudanabaenales cyanobacterium]|nr:transposase family protein [Pseudanabaenales cyanobacterium]
MYELWLILLLIVMGTLSGFEGYAALEDFGVRHYPAFCEALALTGVKYRVHWTSEQGNLFNTWLLATDIRC